MRGTQIYLLVKLTALTISDLGTWGHLQGRRLQAHKKRSDFRSTKRRLSLCQKNEIRKRDALKKVLRENMLKRLTPSAAESRWPLREEKRSLSPLASGEH